MPDNRLAANSEVLKLAILSKERGLANIGGLNLQRLYYTLEVLGDLLHLAFKRNVAAKVAFEGLPIYEFAKGVNPEVVNLNSGLHILQHHVFDIRHHLLLLADTDLPEGGVSVSVAARFRSGAIEELRTADDSLLRPDNLRKVEKEILSAPDLLGQVAQLLKNDPVLRGIINRRLENLRKEYGEVKSPDDICFKDWLSSRGAGDLQKRHAHVDSHEIARNLMIHMQSADHAAEIAGGLKGVFEWMIQACGIKEDTWLEKALDSKPLKALGITSLLKSLLAQEPTTAGASLLR